MNKVLQFLESEKRGLWLILFLNILLHIWFINLPPCSVHVWRQCNTLAVARNFSEESMNIFKPRVDRRSYSDGVTGMQFPAYEYVVALFYKAIGEHHFVARVISLIFTCLGIVFFYFFIFEISNSKLAAFISAWSLCWCPELFYYGICALPDVLALSAGIASLYFVVKWSKTSKSHLLFSLLLLTLAGLVKIQFMMFGAVTAVIVIRKIVKREIKYMQLIPILTTCVLSIALCLAWYVYAINLINKSGLRDFGLDFRPAESFSAAIKIISKNFISDLPELLLNYSGLLLFVTGIVLFFVRKKWKSTFFVPLLFWFILFATYYFVELRQMEAHQYYLFPCLPILFLITGYGGLQISKSKSAFVLLIILIAQPVLACIRILPARFLNANNVVPKELFNEKTNLLLRNSIPDNSLCLAGPDRSGCIYLYFLHKKGMDFSYPEQLDTILAISGITYIEDCIENGAQYLITPEKSVFENDELKKYFKREVISVKDFKVIELKSVKDLRN